MTNAEAAEWLLNQDPHAQFVISVACYYEDRIYRVPQQVDLISEEEKDDPENGYVEQDMEVFLNIGTKVDITLF